MTHPTTIPMPQLTEGMEEATIAKWLVDPGAPVAIGDELVEIETDKATMAYLSEAAGVLEPLVGEGETVTVGRAIALLHAVPAQTGRAAPPTSDRPDDRPAEPSAMTSGPELAHPPNIQVGLTQRDEEALATPLARRLAEDLGVVLGAVVGTGPRGRIRRDDVLRAAGREPEKAARPTTPALLPGAAQPTASGGERRALSSIQRAIARRMAEAKATVPHFQVSCDVSVDAALALRRELQNQLGEGARGPSLNDFIVRACGLALRDHELVNASFAGDHFQLHDGIHIGVAVAVEAGLLVATITDADRRSIVALAHETRRLAESVRAGTASPNELTGATFTVSNLGMFGMTSIAPVINPPQAAILGVGAARDELYLADGEVAVRQVSTLTLSGDHRILNGADAARFLTHVKDLIETPLRLIAT